jgi:two-component system, NtrC family, response regulator AtoC
LRAEMTPPRATVLVVEDDRDMRLLLEDELRESGYEVLTAAEGGEALAWLKSAPVDVIVTDLVMPGMDGRELLEEVHRSNQDVPIIITTAFGTIESAVDAMKAGAYHYLPKPFGMDHMQAALENALAERRLKLELHRHQVAADVDELGFVAVSQGMRAAVEVTLRAARADTPVLLLGESGTGKELLARLLHSRSPRAEGRFVAVNCAAIPETLLESLLFGHRKGSFTDAREDQRGLMHEADGGTILLDEIGDMAPALQAKLLRVLQEREIQPIGAAAPVKVNVRIVAATHRDLEQLVEEGRFRRDLFYRLNVIAIAIPPLRERPEDLVPLIAHFLGKHGGRNGREHARISVAALEALRRHSWPGNVRELENAIERALVLGRANQIELEDLPAALRGRGTPEASAELGPLAKVERDHIVRTLQSVKGNKSAAARLLGLDRKTLYRKLEAYGLRRE